MSDSLSSYPAPGGTRELWHIAYPLILNNAAMVVMQFVDRMFLARHSTQAVAAALPGGILSFTLMAFFQVTIGFASTVVSQYHGRGDREGCAKAPWAAFHLCLPASLSCILMTYVGPYLIDLSNHPHEVLWREKVYFQMLMPGGGFACMNLAFLAFFSGRGKTWIATLVSFITCGLNVLLNYAFIFGNWGAPEMGIAGAGFATFLSTMLGPFLSGTLFLIHDQREYPTRRSLLPDWREILRLLRFGAPSGLQVFLDVAAWSFFLSIVGNLGVAALAATTIALSINMISFMPLMGIGEATSIVVGQYVGRGRKDISEKAAYTAWKMAALYMIPMGLIFLLFPRHLFGLFQPMDEGAKYFEEVMGYGRSILMCAACYNFFDATFFVFMGALRGAGDTRKPMWIVILFSWCLLVPGAILLVLVIGCTVLQAWLFIISYVFLLCLVLFRRFRGGSWKSIEVLEDVLASPGDVQSLMEVDLNAPKG